MACRRGSCVDEGLRLEWLGERQNGQACMCSDCRVRRKCCERLASFTSKSTTRFQMRISPNQTTCSLSPIYTHESRDSTSVAGCTEVVRLGTGNACEAPLTGSSGRAGCMRDGAGPRPSGDGGVRDSSGDAVGRQASSVSSTLGAVERLYALGPMAPLVYCA